MKDIILLIGESATGKDAIMNELVKRYGWHRMVSYTTRPPRPNEEDGVAYHFVSEDRFKELLNSGALFEQTKYESEKGTWYYGFGKDSIKEGETNVCVINPHGLEQFRDSEIKDRLVVFRISTPIEQRYYRYSNRLGREMTAIEKAEAWDRLGRDLKDFPEDLYNYNHVIFNYDGVDIEAVSNSIANIILTYRLRGKR